MYLGLVVAGATPQVLASAAMTRSFDVRDEIEGKDDLDKKPDDDRTPVPDSVQGYLQDVEYFFINLRRLGARGSFYPGKDVFDVEQSTVLPCVDGNRAGRYTPVRFIYPNELSRPVAMQFSQSMVFGYSLGDCINNGVFSETAAVDSSYSFKLDANGFSVKLSIKKQSPQNASALLRELKSALDLYAAEKNNTLRKKIIDSTSFRAENDQIFIVTRLPRAGLDSLLAKDAK